MLGKLIKYDLKSMNKLLFLIHSFLLLSAIAIRLIIATPANLQTIGEPILFILASILYVIIIIGAGYGTYIIICVRFYKNIFSDEGYLTHTLPVTRGQLLLSKTISGSIWCFVDNVLIFISLYIVILNPLFMVIPSGEKELMLQEMGFSQNPGAFFIILIIFTMASSISNVVMFYASIALGQLFTSHRVIGAVACYFIISTLVSILSFVLMLMSGFIQTTGYTVITNTISLDMTAYLTTLFIITGILMAITTVIFYYVTYYMMEKKRNLI